MKIRKVKTVIDLSHPNKVVLTVTPAKWYVAWLWVKILVLVLIGKDVKDERTRSKVFRLKLW